MSTTENPGERESACGARVPELATGRAARQGRLDRGGRKEWER